MGSACPATNSQRVIGRRNQGNCNMPELSKTFEELRNSSVQGEVLDLGFAAIIGQQPRDAWILG